MYLSVCASCTRYENGKCHISEQDDFSVATTVLLVAKCHLFKFIRRLLKYEDIIFWVCHKHGHQNSHMLLIYSMYNKD